MSSQPDAVKAQVAGQPMGIQQIYYELRARHSGKCLDVYGGSTDDGASVIQFSCHGGYNQQWRLWDVGGGYYELTARHSGKCLDVYGGSTDDGASVIQFSCHGGYNQQWGFYY
jgi:Ricin-type beta-trefoil lectin domain-like